MVLAVIFAQRWKVIDARAPAGPMSPTSVVQLKSLAPRVVAHCKRQFSLGLHARDIRKRTRFLPFHA
jgi:hypothetical protein